MRWLLFLLRIGSTSTRVTAYGPLFGLGSRPLPNLITYLSIYGQRIDFSIFLCIEYVILFVYHSSAQAEAVLRDLACAEIA